MTPQKICLQDLPCFSHWEKETSKTEAKSNHHLIGSSCLCLIQIQFAMIRNNHFPYSRSESPQALANGSQIVVVIWLAICLLFLYPFCCVVRNEEKQFHFNFIACRPLLGKIADFERGGNFVSFGKSSFGT